MGTATRDAGRDDRIAGMLMLGIGLALVLGGVIAFLVLDRDTGVPALGIMGLLGAYTAWRSRSATRHGERLGTSTISCDAEDYTPGETALVVFSQQVLGGPPAAPVAHAVVSVHEYTWNRVRDPAKVQQDRIIDWVEEWTSEVVAEHPMPAQVVAASGADTVTVQAQVVVPQLPPVRIHRGRPSYSSVSAWVTIDLGDGVTAGEVITLPLSPPAYRVPQP